MYFGYNLGMEKKRAGRPRSDRAAPISRAMRLREEDDRRLKALANLWGSSEVAVVRRLLLEAARKEGLE